MKRPLYMKRSCPRAKSLIPRGDVGNKGNYLQLSNQTYRTCKISYFYHSKDSQVQNTQKCRVDNDFNLLLKRQYFILLSQNNKIIIIF